MAEGDLLSFEQMGSQQRRQGRFNDLEEGRQSTVIDNR